MLLFQSDSLFLRHTNQIDELKSTCWLEHEMMIVVWFFLESSLEYWGRSTEGIGKEKEIVIRATVQVRSRWKGRRRKMKIVRTEKDILDNDRKCSWQYVSQSPWSLPLISLCSLVSLKALVPFFVLVHSLSLLFFFYSLFSLVLMWCHTMSSFSLDTKANPWEWDEGCVHRCYASHITTVNTHRQQSVNTDTLIHKENQADGRYVCLTSVNE